MLPTDPYERGWLVGFVEGRGSFTTSNGKNVLKFKIGAEHRDLLELVLRLVPGSRSYGPYEYSNPASKTGSADVICGGQSAIRFAEAVAPLLTPGRRQEVEEWLAGGHES